MDSLQSVVPSGHSSETYKLAKMEHYLRRAESCFHMARYAAAEKAIGAVLKLSPNDSAAHSLSKRINLQFAILRNRNGHSAPSPTETKSRSNRKIVLIVDQDERVLSRLSMRLRKFGFDPVCALNSAEALETLGLVTPDLVISEVNFEDGPTGYALFTEIRSLPETSRVPFLFLATRIDREVLIAGKRLGVDDFLFKPVDDDVVAASVMNCITRSKNTSS